MSFGTAVPLLILGAGPAGLAAGMFARSRGIDFRILEAANVIGGLTRTFHHEGFAFDSGAHRLHDKDPWATQQVMDLLGPDLRQVDRPSLIYDAGHLLPFPLSAGSVLRRLGVGRSLVAGLHLLRSRLGTRTHSGSFEDFALRAYGRTIADRYLLGYSEKLWGVPCSQLTPEIAGKRLRGMDLRQALAGILMPGRGDHRHVEGRFFYPRGRGGIGTITNTMADRCGRDRIHLQTPVTRLHHDGRRITHIATAGSSPIPVTDVISTLPLDHLIQHLTPAIPELAEHARHLHYRALILVAILLRCPAVTSAATVYFPAPEIPFNRVSEPIQRSPEMAPEGCTSLVAEIACDEGDAFWSMPDHGLVDLTLQHLRPTGWVTQAHYADATVRRLRRAYPVLTLSAVRHAREALALLRQFGNLHVVGRNARFEYSWIHNQIRNAHETVAALSDQPVMQP